MAKKGQRREEILQALARINKGIIKSGHVRLDGVVPVRDVYQPNGDIPGVDLASRIMTGPDSKWVGRRVGVIRRGNNLWRTLSLVRIPSTCLYG